VCIYYQDWHRTKRPRLAAEGGLLPAVSHAMQAAPPAPDTASAFSSPRNTLSSGVGVGDVGRTLSPPPPLLQTPALMAAPAAPSTSTALPFDEEAKLVFGVLFSLRNMVKKLSGRCVDFPFASLLSSSHGRSLQRRALHELPYFHVSIPSLRDALRLQIRHAQQSRCGLAPLYATPDLRWSIPRVCRTESSRRNGFARTWGR
jgi:hypothetical protein